MKWGKCTNDYQFRLKEYGKQAIEQKNSFVNRKQAFFLLLNMTSASFVLFTTLLFMILICPSIHKEKSYGGMKRSRYEPITKVKGNTN